jgi:sugar phosphate permease
VRRPRPSKLVRFIKAYRIHWAVLTMVLNLAAIVLVVFVFPEVSNLWVSIFVLVGAFTASVTSLGDMLVSAEESDLDQAEANGFADGDGG